MLRRSAGGLRGCKVGPRPSEGTPATPSDHLRRGAPGPFTQAEAASTCAERSPRVAGAGRGPPTDERRLALARAPVALMKLWRDQREASDTPKGLNLGTVVGRGFEFDT